MRRLSVIAGRSKKSPKFGASWWRIEPEDLKPVAVKSPDLRAKDFAYGCPCRVPPRAADCEQLAKEALTEEHRQKILTIARSWRQLADQRERMSLTVDKARPPQR